MRVELSRSASARATRCPACHEALQVGQRTLSCTEAHAAIHEACAELLAFCPALGCEALLEREAREGLDDVTLAMAMEEVRTVEPRGMALSMGMALLGGMATLAAVVTESFGDRGVLIGAWPLLAILSFLRGRRSLLRELEAATPSEAARQRARLILDTWRAEQRLDEPQAEAARRRWSRHLLRHRSVEGARRVSAVLAVLDRAARVSLVGAWVLGIAAAAAWSPTPLRASGALLACGASAIALLVLHELCVPLGEGRAMRRLFRGPAWRVGELALWLTGASVITPLSWCFGPWVYLLIAAPWLLRPLVARADGGER